MHACRYIICIYRIGRYNEPYKHCPINKCAWNCMNNKIHNPIDKSSHASNILIIQATLIKGKLIKVVIQLIRAVKVGDIKMTWNILIIASKK